jgi:hypothetical protein
MVAASAFMPSTDIPFNREQHEIEKSFKLFASAS